jgi:DNA helicase-2/ATP-dependent DNA helicase PcrA
MIQWNDFEDTVIRILERNISVNDNEAQNNAIRAPLNQPLFLVAGPGSGKTTVLALRVLKLIYVDDVDPSSIIATTFTKKAASELRSRILGWGDQLRQSFLSNSSYSHLRNQITRVDFNQIVTGTLDSISEEILSEYRAPATPPPIVIEDFVENAIMLKEGLFEHGLHRDQDLFDYTAQFNGSRQNIGDVCDILLQIKDRVFQDRINIEDYRRECAHPGASVACNAINNYLSALRERFLYDFSLLENEFLNRLEQGQLDIFLENIKYLLVDEYQDTNLLQEQIYFNIATRIMRNGGSITIVGDDDQSLYRFRGATVDLFYNFETRIRDQIQIEIDPIFLIKNYRSTDNIVDFCNSFISLDDPYQNSRITDKPPIEPSRIDEYTNFPILGIFRDDVDTLARDLSNYIQQIVRGDGVRIADVQGNQFLIRTNERGGPSDLAVLTFSPKETLGERVRLPALLRSELQRLDPPLNVFNPRGKNFENVREVSILCGLVLECIDPDSTIQDSITKLPRNVRSKYDEWRMIARDFVASNPLYPDFVSKRLDDFVTAWQHRRADDGDWPSEVPLMGLIYKLITWIPEMQNDVEGLVYLEGIVRTIGQTAFFSTYKGNILNDKRWREASIREALWSIFMPLAGGSIDVNEKLLETLPQDRINIMSIHQSKGLEFPLVIVDVGSDFKTKHPSQAKHRFPRIPNNTCLLEDELRPYSPLNVPDTPALDRSFDDLIRLYFEAYSRARDVLIVVGLTSARWHIPNIATGWDRSETQVWGAGLPNIIHI